MTGTNTNSDTLQQAINAINELSGLVGRYVFNHSPEEADDAQRRGFEAIRKLKQLKDATAVDSAPGVAASSTAVGENDQAAAA